jgi:hypothetical protein
MRSSSGNSSIRSSFARADAGMEMTENVAQTSDGLQEWFYY